MTDGVDMSNEKHNADNGIYVTQIYVKKIK